MVILARETSIDCWPGPAFPTVLLGVSALSPCPLLLFCSLSPWSVPSQLRIIKHGWNASMCQVLAGAGEWRASRRVPILKELQSNREDRNQTENHNRLSRGCADCRRECVIRSDPFRGFLFEPRAIAWWVSAWQREGNRGASACQGDWRGEAIVGKSPAHLEQGHGQGQRRWERKAGSCGPLG